MTNRLIHQLFASFQEHASRDCIRIGESIARYEEILALASTIRQALAQESSQNIGLYLTDDVYMYAAILAIWLEGKTYVPLHPDFPANKNLSIIEQAEIEAILSSSALNFDTTAKVIATTNLPKAEASEPKAAGEDSNAYILFTSGSTGDPKGVPITFSNLYYFSSSFREVFGSLTPADRVLQMFELTFDLSVMSYLLPWLSGSCVVALHKKETKYLQILDLMEANEISAALMVPSILNLIIPYLDPEITNSSLRLCLFCGEALLEKQMLKWRHFIPNAKIYNVYGPTENTIFCTYYEVNHEIKQRNGIISIGKSMPYSQLSFKDPNDTEGELLLSGNFLTKHYWKNTGKTQETFIEKEGQRYYKTGDWCCRDGDGDYFYLNRIDFQAKINGFRVELSEVEYFANQVLEHGTAVALIHKDTNGNDAMALFINDLNCDDAAVIRHLKQNLPPYSVPEKIIKLEKFPENTSGKTDRKELKKFLE